MMLKKTKVLFLFCFMIVVQSANFNITLRCQKCSVTCQFANCYRVTSTDYDRQACGLDSCVLGNTLAAQISSCAYRFIPTDPNPNTNLPCTTGVCYNIPNRMTCFNGTCDSDYSQSLICRACTNSNIAASCANNCQYSVRTNSEECSSAPCLIGFEHTVAYGPCPNDLDVFGNTCSSCCSKSTYKFIAQRGYCTQDFSFLSSNDFTAYAKTKLASSSTKSSQKLSLLLLNLAAILVMLLN